MNKFQEIGQLLGELVTIKNEKYGDSFKDSTFFLELLYPNGIHPNQYTDMLALVRMFDKMKRIATDKESLGESPFVDIGGYSILGIKNSGDALDKLRDYVKEIRNEKDSEYISGYGSNTGSIENEGNTGIGYGAGYFVTDTSRK
jgi:hypothetical protein